ncbi:MAG TPA: SH3 domain-containing protein [Pyrinomonadaceae bacterium]|nr:SH3 domain-containing protein [Pyrinomonadaceae bacterium]
MRFVLLILIFPLLSCISVFAQTETKCDVPAFVTDPSSGVNVRAGAGKDSKIVKTVPKDEGRTMFDVVGSKGDWLKVAYAVNSKNENVFSGTGWVHAPLLGVKEKLNKYKVFESPTTKSKRIDIGLFEHILPLAGCKGEWVKVQLPVTGTDVSEIKRTGWMPPGSHCGNPWMECDY